MRLGGGRSPPTQESVPGPSSSCTGTFPAQDVSLPPMNSHLLWRRRATMQPMATKKRMIIRTGNPKSKPTEIVLGSSDAVVLFEVRGVKGLEDKNTVVCWPVVGREILIEVSLMVVALVSACDWLEATSFWGKVIGSVLGASVVTSSSVEDCVIVVGI